MLREINHIGLIVGKRGTGKTVFGKELIKNTKLPKVLVIDTFLHPSYSDLKEIKPDQLSRWKKGKYRMIIRDAEDLEPVNEHVYNTLIVMEDSSKYLVGDLQHSPKGIIFDSKQKNNDIIIMYHGFSFIPPKVLSNCNSITLFKIGENIARYANKIPNFDTINKAHQLIQSSSDPYIRKTIQVN